MGGTLSAVTSVEAGIDHFLAFLSQSGKAVHTIRAYRRDLAQFSSFLHPRVSGATPTISGIAPDLVVEFTERLCKRGLRQATVARKTSALRSFFRFLCKRGILQRNPADDITSSSNVTRTETPTLKTAFIEAALERSGSSGDFQASRDRAMLEVLYGAGLRLHEIVSLNLSALDMDKHLLKVTSGNRERLVPIGQAAREALRSYLLLRAEQLVSTSIGQIDAGALFVNKEGRRLHRRSIQRIVEYHLSGVDGVATSLQTQQQRQGSRELRRAFADHLVKAGAAVAAVRALLDQESLPALSPSAISFEELRQRYDRAHPRAGL